MRHTVAHNVAVYVPGVSYQKEVLDGVKASRVVKHLLVDIKLVVHKRSYL